MNFDLSKVRTGVRYVIDGIGVVFVDSYSDPLKTYNTHEEILNSLPPLSRNTPCKNARLKEKYGDTN